MYFQVRQLLMNLCCKNKAHLSVVVFFKCLQADCSFYSPDSKKDKMLFKGNKTGMQ